MENEIERCRVLEYRRTAAPRTGVDNASPTASGNSPPVNANHFTFASTITARAAAQIQTPRKKVFRKPIASVSEPTNKVKTVMVSDQAATRPSASLSL